MTHTGTIWWVLAPESAHSVDRQDQNPSICVGLKDEKGLREEYTVHVDLGAVKWVRTSPLTALSFSLARVYIVWI